MASIPVPVSASPRVATLLLVSRHSDDARGGGPLDFHHAVAAAGAGLVVGFTSAFGCCGISGALALEFEHLATAASSRR